MRWLRSSGLLFGNRGSTPCLTHLPLVEEGYRRPQRGPRLYHPCPGATSGPRSANRSCSRVTCILSEIELRTPQAVHLAVDLSCSASRSLPPRYDPSCAARIACGRPLRSRGAVSIRMSHTISDCLLLVPVVDLVILRGGWLFPSVGVVRSLIRYVYSFPMAL